MLEVVLEVDSEEEDEVLVVVVMVGKMPTMEGEVVSAWAARRASPGEVIDTGKGTNWLWLHLQ